MIDARSGGRYVSGRWRRVVLAVSVAMNLFLLAYVGGQILRPEPKVDMNRPLFEVILAKATARMSAEDATHFRTVMEHEAPNYVQAAQDMIAARDRVERTVSHEPFDATLIRAQISGWRDAWYRFTGPFGTALVDAMAGLSPEGRRTLVAVSAEARDAQRRAGP